MPLGKDSIKRVRNNGYSQVTSSAPDMENSTIVEEALSVPVVAVDDAPRAEEPKKAPKKKAEPKRKTKAEPKRTPGKRTKKQETPTPVSNNDIPTPVEVADTVATREGEGYVNLGGQMPVHLL